MSQRLPSPSADTVRIASWQRQRRLVRHFAVLVVGVVAGFVNSEVRADLEFVGVLVTSRGTWLALGDTATGKTDWIARGEKFGGYTLKSYDAKHDLVTLLREDVELELHLKDDAKVKSDRLELTGAITFGGSEQIEVQRATLQFDQENVFPLKDGITYRITPTRRPDGNISYRVAVDRAIAENKTETIAAPSVIARPGQRFAVRLHPDFGFSFAPR